MTTRRYKPYPTYKDSGVEWLGEIPAHWEVYALRRKLFREAGSIKIGPFGSALKLEFMTQEGFKVYGQEHVIARDFSRGSKYIDQAKFSELAACEIRPRDIVVTMMGSSGRSAVVPDGIEQGIMDSHLLRIRLPDAELHPKFLALLIDEADYVRDQIGAAGKGAIMHGLNSSIIKSIVLAAPPTTEQSRILAFLDRETARIDALVAKKERLIELLLEQRTALITHALTKGLDPTVPMRHSGVQWLGEIPAGWEVKRVKNIARFVTSGSRGWAQHYDDKGAIFLRIGNLKTGSVDLDLSDVQHVSPPPGTEGERTRVRPGDVVVSITALIGAVGVVPVEMPTGFVNQHLALVRLSSRDVQPRWLAYCVLSRVGQEQLQGNLYGGTKDGLNLDDIRSLVVLMPANREQDRLIDTLDRTGSEVDALVAKVRDAIDRLKELRTALISAAVTGKIDVREEVA